MKVETKLHPDPMRFRQLLINLVGNAIKFTESGSVTVAASVDVSAEEPRSIIEVRDTGIGISPDYLDGIFTPFDQADNSITRHFCGTGLGLTICRHIVRALGGNIAVTSQQQVGSALRMTLETGSLDGVPIDWLEQTDASLVRRDATPSVVEDRSCGSDTSKMTDLC